MSPGTKLGDHIDEFNKLILDLENIDIEIEDGDQALMLLTSLPSSYENFMETLLYERESLTMENVLAILNSRELKKRTEGTKEETGDGLYVRGMSGKAHSGGSSRFKSRGGTDKLKCFICHSEGHLKRDCQMKKSSRFVKKGKRDQDSDSSDDEGNAYFGEALVVVGNDEMTELVMDSGDNRTCTIKGTRKVKIQLHDGSSFILEDVRKKNCVYTLEAKVMTFGVQKHGGSKQVGLKQLGSKQVGFKQLGPSVETGVHGVQVEKRVWFEVELKDKHGLLGKGAEKIHLGIKVGANITATGVPGQEGAKDNVAEKKKANETKKANLEKLLKYNAWSTRWSPIRGSSTRKRC
ncbi:zinc finger, CCHC-type containing protein [Tanacetum coccineum]